MKIQGLCSLILIVFSVGACKKDHEGSLTLHFKALYDGLPLAMFETKPFSDPEQLQFTHLSFFVSDLILLDQSSTEYLKDVELVDLSFDDTNSASDGYTIQIGNLPAKNYTGIRFGIGIPPDQNAKSPSDFPSKSPLSKTGYYCVGWSSYIFSKTDGRLDTLGNGTFDIGFTLQTGSDEFYRVLEGALPLTIEAGKESNLDIVIDYRKLLLGYDIKSLPINHNPLDTSQIAKIANNLASSVSIIY